jgi:hypothetical protein
MSHRATEPVRYTGTIPAGSGRAPKTASERRVCAHAACSTVLSRYNLDSYCRIHGRPRYPVLRGVPSREAS